MTLGILDIQHPARGTDNACSRRSLVSRMASNLPEGMKLSSAYDQLPRSCFYDTARANHAKFLPGISMASWKDRQSNCSGVRFWRVRPAVQLILETACCFMDLESQMMSSAPDYAHCLQRDILSTDSKLKARERSERSSTNVMIH